MRSLMRLIANRSDDAAFERVLNTQRAASVTARWTCARPDAIAMLYCGRRAVVLQEKHGRACGQRAT